MSNKQIPAPKITDPASAPLLAEIEDVIRTMPSREVFNKNGPEAFSLFGRAISGVSHRDFAAGERARTAVSLIQNVMMAEFQWGYLALMVVLEQARNSLRFQTLGPVNSAIGQGAVFNSFDEIRKIIELAKIFCLLTLSWMLSLFLDPCRMCRAACRYGFSQASYFWSWSRQSSCSPNNPA
jgi:hypothetical protein